MSVSLGMYNIVEYGNLANNGAKDIGFGLLDGRDDGEHNGVESFGGRSKYFRQMAHFSLEHIHLTECSVSSKM